MACSGCDARREWIKKWSKVAYERAQQLFTQPDPGRADEADRAAAESEQPATADGGPVTDTDPGAGSQ